MKKIILSLLSYALIQTASAQKAEEVFQKHIQAIGGKELIQSVTDLTLSMTTETPRGVSETEMKYKMPEKYAMSVFANGMQVMSMTYDGTQLTSSSPWGGGAQKPITGSAARGEVLRSHPFAELIYLDQNIKPSSVETIQENGVEMIKVQFDWEGQTWTNVYDSQTGLKKYVTAKAKTPRGEFESKVIFEDYKKFKGSDLLFPAKRQQTTGMGNVTSTLASIKVNKGLKDKEFSAN